MGKGRSREINQEAIMIQARDECGTYKGSSKKRSAARYIFNIMNEIFYHTEKGLEKERS